MTATVEAIKARDMILLISELDESLSYDQKETLARAARNSEYLWMGTVDEIPICFFGLIPPTLMSDIAYLWLYTTPAFTDHVFVFVRRSQILVQHMLTLYPNIVGHGKKGDSRSLAWLRWIGAEFQDPVGDFVPFEIKSRAA